jgi:hypothetical protein
MCCLGWSAFLSYWHKITRAHNICSTVWINEVFLWRTILEGLLIRLYNKLWYFLQVVAYRPRSQASMRLMMSKSWLLIASFTLPANRMDVRVLVIFGNFKILNWISIHRLSFNPRLVVTLSWSTSRRVVSSWLIFNLTVLWLLKLIELDDCPHEIVNHYKELFTISFELFNYSEKW